MKKMSEVFDDMPLHINGITCMMDIYQQSNPDEPHQLVAKHAAHAINHVDALAGALDELLFAVASARKDDSINNKIIAAAKALAAYRGEK